jgi:hypothetical protein
MAVSATFLAPGQRYMSASGQPWQVDCQVTILEVERDQFDNQVVTYRSPEGTRVTTFALELEEALEDGQIVPIHGTFRIATC